MEKESNPRNLSVDLGLAIRRIATLPSIHVWGPRLACPHSVLGATQSLKLTLRYFVLAVPIGVEPTYLPVRSRVLLQLSYGTKLGGLDRIRTCILHLRRVALLQLSYETKLGGLVWTRTTPRSGTILQTARRNPLLYQPISGTR